MNTNEWLERNLMYETGHSGHKVKRISRFSPLAVCADGFNVSIQASEGHYSIPRTDIGPYSAVELGYPSAADDLIQSYAEDADRPTETVYGYVPVEVVDALLEKHGGIRV